MSFLTISLCLINAVLVAINYRNLKRAKAAGEKRLARLARLAIAASGAVVVFNIILWIVK